MDPGTALGIASLAYEVTKDLYEYYRAWKDCEKDVAEIRKQLLWHHQAFRVAREIVRQPDLSPAATELLYNALGSCNDAANDLRDILSKFHQQGTPQSAWDKLKTHGRKSCYPFRKATVTAIKANLDDCRDELDLAADLLQLDTTNQMRETLRGIDAKLVSGFESVDGALERLSTIFSIVQTTEIRTRDVEERTGKLNRTLRQEKENEDLNHLLNWFSTANYGQQQTDFYARRQDGTGEWFLQSKEYQEWIFGGSSTLVCPGQPGSGKTIMSALVIHHLNEIEDAQSNGVAYVFCNYKRKDEQSASHLVGALVRQLLQRTGKAPTPITEMYNRRRNKHTPPSWRDLETAFALLVRELCSVRIIIDALDECERDVRMKFVSCLQDSKSIRLLTTTRHIPDILGLFPSCSHLEVRASEADVERYVKSQLPSLPKRVQENVELQEQILATVVPAVDGMFLLAQLYMDSLKDKRTTKSIRAALRSLPQGSDASVYAKAYTEAMDRICSQPREDAALAKEALSWITRCLRPLKLEEFQHALAIETHDTATSLDKENFVPIDETVSLCAGLITVDAQSSIVRLVHYTAQKFFEDKWKDWIPDAESTIALKCLRYMVFQPFSNEPPWTFREVEVSLVSHPVLRYASIYWSNHVTAAARGQGPLPYARVETAALSFLQNDNAVCTAAKARCIDGLPAGEQGSYTFPWSMQGPHLVALLGMKDLAEALMACGVSFECRDWNGRTPLAWAAWRGQNSIVRLLLGRQDLDAGLLDRQGRSPLIHAIRAQHEDAVKTILDSGRVDLNTKHKEFSEPLHHIVHRADETFIKMIPSEVARQVPSDSGRTPLSMAASAGFVVIVKMLLEHQHVDVNAVDQWRRTPLWYAAREGHEEVVRLLLHSGRDVDVEIEDLLGSKPAWIALSRGHIGIMKLIKRASASRT